MNHSTNGQRGETLALLVREAASHDVPSPLSERQVRPVAANELKKLLDAVIERTGLKKCDVDLPTSFGPLSGSFRVSDSNLSRTLATTGVPHFRLWYVGHSPLTSQMIVAGIQWQAKDPNWPPLPVPGHL